MENTERKIAKIPTSDDSCVTFVLNDETHTIGQPLHMMINNQPEVEFAGYSVPHILEKKINFRIQTKSQDHLAVDSLRQGLNDFEKFWRHIDATFDNAVHRLSDSTAH